MNSMEGNLKIIISSNINILYLNLSKIIDQNVYI